MRVVITGAGGNVGGELVRLMADAGDEVRAVTRRAGSADLPDGVEEVVGDLNDPAGLRSVWKGADTLFLLPGYPAIPELLADADHAGLSRVVLLSGGSAGDSTSANAITRYMSVSEEQVRAAGLPYTILRPSGFMSNTLRWASQLSDGDVVEDAFADVPIAVIDPYDIAAVAATVLLSDPGDHRHDGKVYRLSGPEALLPADRLRILAEVLDRPLRFEPKSNDDAYKEMSAAMPIEYVEAFFDFYLRGTLDESVIYPAVAEVTGRPPRTFTEWAHAHAAAFA
jgi:uncharacterized protein YbjT (DUF2867 family)